MNANCRATFSDHQVFTVTHLREPISRHNSEYWYTGPGSKLHASNHTTWLEWTRRPLPSRMASFNASW